MNLLLLTDEELHALSRALESVARSEMGQRWLDAIVQERAKRQRVQAAVEGWAHKPMFDWDVT